MLREPPYLHYDLEILKLNTEDIQTSTQSSLYVQ